MFQKSNLRFWFNVQILQEVGFEAVTAEDRTAQFGQIIESELKNFEQSKDKFVKVSWSLLLFFGIKQGHGLMYEPHVCEHGCYLCIQCEYLMIVGRAVTWKGCKWCKGKGREVNFWDNGKQRKRQTKQKEEYLPPTLLSCLPHPFIESFESV